MAYNYNKLRGRIVEKFGTMQVFAEKLDISYTALSAKMNNKIGLSQSDIVIWGELLDIPEEEYKAYFFTRLVQ